MNFHNTNTYCLLNRSLTNSVVDSKMRIKRSSKYFTFRKHFQLSFIHNADSVDTVRILVENGADVNDNSTVGTALHTAVENGSHT